MVKRQPRAAGAVPQVDGRVPGRIPAFCPAPPDRRFRSCRLQRSRDRPEARPLPHENARARPGTPPRRALAPGAARATKASRRCVAHERACRPFRAAPHCWAGRAPAGRVAGVPSAPYAADLHSSVPNILGGRRSRGADSPPFCSAGVGTPPHARQRPSPKEYRARGSKGGSAPLARPKGKARGSARAFRCPTGPGSGNPPRRPRCRCRTKLHGQGRGAG